MEWPERTPAQVERARVLKELGDDEEAKRAEWKRLATRRAELLRTLTLFESEEGIAQHMENIVLINNETDAARRDFLAAQDAYSAVYLDEHDQPNA